MTELARFYIPNHGRPIRVRTHDADLPAKYAGFMFVVTTGDTPAVLLVRRTGADHQGEWAFPGGHIEPGESSLMGACREVYEETGWDPRGWAQSFANSASLGVREGFETFVQCLPRGFMPTLNDEHDAWTWCPIDELPDNTHPNAAAFITNFRDNFRGSYHG